MAGSFTRAARRFPPTGLRSRHAVAASRVVTGLLLLGLCGLCFFYRLGSFPLLGPDEPRYAQVAWEMWQRADPVSPTIGGQLWAEKPPLLYWAMGLAYGALGRNEWAARLPSALAATLMVLVVNAAGRRLRSPRYGLLAALVTATSAFTIGFAHGATTDMLLATTLAAGLCSLAPARANEPPGAWRLAAAAVWFAAAVLAKGPVGLLLAIAIAVSWRFTAGWRPRLPGLQLAGSGILFAALTAAWYLPVTLRHGRVFLDEFFVRHNLLRFLTDLYHHPGPVYYYLVVLAAGSLPWTAFLVLAGARRWQRRRPEPDPSDHIRALTLPWIGIPTLFFTLSASKLPGYVLPVAPAIALLVATELDRLFDGRRGRGSAIAAGASAATLAAAAVALVVLAPDRAAPLPWLLLAAIAPAVGVIAVSRSAPRVVAAMVLSTAAVFTVAIHDDAAPVVRSRSLARIARRAVTERRPGEPVLGYRFWDHALTFYTDAASRYDSHGNVIISRTPEELVATAAGPLALVATRRPFVADLTRDGRYQVEELAAERDVVLLRLHPREQIPGGVRRLRTRP